MTVLGSLVYDLQGFAFILPHGMSSHAKEDKPCVTSLVG